MKFDLKNQKHLSIVIDTLTDDYFILSQSTRLTDRRTDGRTEFR